MIIPTRLLVENKHNTANKHNLPSFRGDVQRDVERHHRVRQRAGRDERHPRLSDRVHGVQRHVPARFGLHLSRDLLHRGRHILEGHVIEHHPRHRGRVERLVVDQRQDLVHLLERPRLHFDLRGGFRLRQVRLRVRDRGFDPPARGDVVVFDHDHVEEAHAVVLPAADEHRPLVGQTQSGDGLPRLEHERGRGGVRHLLRERGDPGHPLHEVQDDSLRAQDAVRLASHLAEDLPALDRVAVDFRESHLDVGIDRAQDHHREVLPREDAVRFREERRRGHGLDGDRAQRRDVAHVRDVLLERELYRVLDAVGRMMRRGDRRRLERGVGRLAHRDRAGGDEAARGRSARGGHASGGRARGDQRRRHRGAVGVVSCETRAAAASRSDSRRLQTSFSRVASPEA
eukprot:29122-Pelagococcus_subviridis.AAC.12